MQTPRSTESSYTLVRSSTPRRSPAPRFDKTPSCTTDGLRLAMDTLVHARLLHAQHPDFRLSTISLQTSECLALAPSRCSCRHPCVPPSFALAMSVGVCDFRAEALAGKTWYIFDYFVPNPRAVRTFGVSTSLSLLQACAKDMRFRRWLPARTLKSFGLVLTMPTSRRLTSFRTQRSVSGRRTPHSLTQTVLETRRGGAEDYLAGLRLLC
ncbi:hypothetical protein BV25DRAFT_1552310 [Artomyces pyxidatus]|uniref:Uncharacterized protein n=1 Tax=Artomyces pyxidatus TaxID=48021 RepID=A0ACB8SL52_9AGAM|nr:hypothetical protein BV25DRAFT_1552310 [Artomyces pyxidatus]